jgi:hypothetical protein
MQENVSVPYQEIPGNKLQAKAFVNWTGLDGFVFFASIGISIALGIWTHWLAGLAMVIFLLPLSAKFKTSMGRVYYEIAKGVYGEYLVHALRGVLWRSNDTSNKFVQWLRYKKYRRNAPATIPLQLGRVQATIEGKLERFSLIHQLDRPYDHIYLAARGGAFADIDIARNHRAVGELARLTNQVITQTSLRVGISYLRIKGPFDPTKIAQYLRTNMNPFIANPDRFELDPELRDFTEWMRENSKQLRPMARAFGGAESWYVIVITIKRTGAWRTARKGKLDDQQLYELPIVELGRAMVDTLQHSPLLELTDIRCLSLAELSSMVRCSIDVTDIQDYYQKRAAGEIPKTDEEIDELLAQYGEEYVNDALQVWPTECIEVSGKDNYLKLDGNYITTLRVTQLPQQARADQFLALHYMLEPGQWSRQAMVGESASGNAETQQLIINQSAQISLNAAFKNKRLITSPKFRRRQQELSQQVDQISANSVSQHFNMLITVIAPDLASMKRNRQKVISKCAANNFKVETIEGAGFQLDAGISGMLGINRL